MKIAIMIVLTITLGLVAAQGGHAENGPSAGFEKTKNQAAPPLDLRLPFIYLRDATPIHEEPQEPAPIRQAPSTSGR